MSENTSSDNTNEDSYVSSKIMIIHVIILLVAITLTATLTYAFVSKQYLDDIDSQNDQIRTLQNILRASNGLDEIEEGE